MYFALKRFLLSLIAVLLIAGTLYSSSPFLAIRKVEAQIPTIESAGPQLLGITAIAHASAISATANAATAGSTAGTAVATGLQATIMNVLNGIAWQVAKVAIQSMTKSIVTWILNGYKGAPTFATDLQKNLRQVADAAVGDYLKQVANNAAIKSPFLDKVIQAAGAAYYINSSKDAFANQLKYNLNQTTRNDRAFLAGNFNNGGFDSWMAAIRNPANNAFGAQLIVGQQIAATAEAQILKRTTELNWGKGFLSFRGSCAVSLGHVDGPTIEELQASGQWADIPNDPSAGSSQTTTKTAPTPLADSDTCYKYNIETPGSVIENQLGITLSSPLRQLELADSINEIVGAVVTQMVTQVIGATGLLGSNTNSSSNGGNSVLATATNPAAYSTNNTNISNGFSQTLQTNQTQIQTYQANWQKIQSAAQGAQAALQSSSCADPASFATVQNVLTQAAANLSRATKATTAATTLQKEIASAQSAASSNQSTLLQTASADYSTFLSSPTVPSAAEISDAQIQSSDTGSGTTPSLYTQMTTITQNAGKCVAGQTGI